MNSLELAEHRILMALYISHHRDPSLWLSREEMQLEYHVVVEAGLFQSILTGLRKAGLVQTARDEKGVDARLNKNGQRDSLARILATLDADTFDVIARQERILTDADLGDQDRLIPTPNHWMIMTCAKINPGKKSAAGVSGAMVLPTPNSGTIIQNFGGGNIIGGDINMPSAAPVHEPPSGWAKWGTIIAGMALVTSILIAMWQMHAFS